MYETLDKVIKLCEDNETFRKLLMATLNMKYNSNGVTTLGEENEPS